MAAPEAVSFPVFGDLHLGYDSEAWENAAGALRDAISLGPDFLLYTGDLINLSPEHWGLFRRLQTINPGLSLRASRGNADAAAGDDKVWLREIGHPLRSVLDVGHVRVLVLGGVSDDHELPLGPSAGEWLRANAAARPDAVVVVLSHAPLKNTTFWSCDNAESGCLASQLDPTNPPYHLYLLQSAEIAEALAESPNVALFVSGHVHNDHRLRCDHGMVHPASVTVWCTWSPPTWAAGGTRAWIGRSIDGSISLRPPSALGCVTLWVPCGSTNWKRPIR